MNSLNPIFEACGVKMTLTEICHDAGTRARITGYQGLSGNDAYLPAYYDTLRKLCPDHPALVGYRD
jgi:hypothetical protein